MNVKNIYYLGIKEWMTLRRDPILIGFILYVFTVSIYIAGTATSETLHKTPISIVDEDQSELSRRVIDAFSPPYFTTPTQITLGELDERMNQGLDSFSIIIPRKFEQDLLSGKKPVIQLYIDATQVSQALTNSEHIQQIIIKEVTTFLPNQSLNAQHPIDIPFRVLFNPELKKSWFSGLMELVDSITLLSIVLTGAALIREREHGTFEHILMLPVTPLEIILSKIWSMQLIVLIASFISLGFVIRLLVAVPIQGSLFLFMMGILLVLFAMTSLGTFLGTVARSMPQFALILILILLPMQILSGSLTPRESMPISIQNMMLLMPHTHFVMLSQAVLLRGASLKAIWPQLLALAIMGTILFSISLTRFRKTLPLLAV